MLNTRIDACIRECQLFAGRVPFTHRGQAHRVLADEFVSRLPLPEQPLEKLVFKELLFEVALRWSGQVHAQHHAEGIAACAFDSSADIAQSWHESGGSPVTTFGRWATVFLDKVERSHRPPASLRVKEIIDRGSDRRLNIKWLARETACHPARLRRLFKRDFGMSIREYQTRRQILKAAQLLVGSDLKVDAIARTVGFPNRKNFYEAFHRIVGAAPSALWKWSDPDIALFERRLFPESAQPLEGSKER